MGFLCNILRPFFNNPTPIYVDHLKKSDRAKAPKVTPMDAPPAAHFHLLPAGVPCSRCKGSGREPERPDPYIEMVNHIHSIQFEKDKRLSGFSNSAHLELSNYWHNFLKQLEDLPPHRDVVLLDHELPSL